MTEPLDQNRLKILSYLHFFLWSGCCLLFFSHPFLAIIENPEIFVLFFMYILPLFSSHSADRSYRNGLMRLYTALVTNVEMTQEKSRASLRSSILLKKATKKPTSDL